jgi:hypothetical protein
MQQRLGLPCRRPQVRRCVHLLKASRTHSERLSLLGSSFSDFADELDELNDKVSATFPGHRSEEHLYIFVVPVQSGEWSLSLMHMDNADVTTAFILLSFTISPSCRLTWPPLLSCAVRARCVPGTLIATIIEFRVKHNQTSTIGLTID